MSLFPERGPELVKPVPDTIELPPEIKNQGIETVDTAVKANVQQDGQQLIQTPANQTVAIQIPNTQTNLIAWSKGGIIDSITWLAMFWLRIIKKALARGQRVEVKN